MQLVFAVCLPLAVLLGYFLADPGDTGNVAIITAVVLVLAIPVLMRWYHPLLIFSWNTVISPFFLPGRPYLWMLLALAGLTFGVLNRISNTEERFVVVPSITWALLGLLGVVVLTGLARGGWGIRALGSVRYGGKGYAFIGAAVAGYFAFASRRIPRERAGLLVALFFLPGLTALVPNLAYLAGARAEFLFYLFPADYASEQFSSDYRLNAEYVRVVGLMGASSAVYCWLLARYGLRGIFDWSRPWRILVLSLAAAACLLCGFRSALGLFGLTIAVQMYLEGLFRPRLLAALGACAGVIFLLLLPNSDKLPTVVQRTISFLPVDISPTVRQQAEATTQWRVQMWQEVLRLVPEYFFKGKGYAIDPGDLAFAQENMARGYARQFASALAAGDYHSGPLTLIIPLGIWGVMAFIWFLTVSVLYLYRNCRTGDPELRNINTLLLAYFVTRLIFFFGIYGSFYSDLYIFTGLVGLSVSLNGVPEPQPEAEEEPEPELEEGLVYHEGLRSD